MEPPLKLFNVIKMTVILTLVDLLKKLSDLVACTDGYTTQELIPMDALLLLHLKMLLVTYLRILTTHQ